MRNHTYVGMADGTLALVQHQTKLYLIDAHQLSCDLFYQQVQGHSLGFCSVHSPLNKLCPRSPHICLLSYRAYMDACVVH